MDDKNGDRMKKLEGDLAAFLFEVLPVGIIVLDDRLAVTYCNAEGKRFTDRHGLPEEVPRIGGRMLAAFHESKLRELFPGEVYIEKRFGESTSKWLFKLHMVGGATPRVAVFIIEEAVSSRLNLNEIRIQYRLTRRETDVLRRVLKGLRNADIADELGISEQTVKDHLSNIYQKIGIENRNDLMGLFIRSEP